MPKYQFQRTESLVISIPPFLDKDTGNYIWDTDTCTMALKRVGALPGTIIEPTPTRDPDTGHWVVTVPPPAPFVAGTYLLYAASTGVGTPLEQLREYTWGDYVDDITIAKTAAQSADGKATAIKAKTDVPAAIAAAADVAAVGTAVAGVGTAVAGVNTKLGTPVVSVSADLATMQAVVTVLQAVAAGKWIIDTVTKQLIVSKSDGLGGWTEVARFDLFDKSGVPSSSQIYRRIPV